MKSRKTIWPYHKWEYVTFSTHHGWEPAEYRCVKCGRIWKSAEDAPKGPCLIAWKDKEDPKIVVILLKGEEEQKFPLEYARRLAHAILRIE